MESISRSMVPAPAEIKTPKPFPFPNGVLKKHHHHHQPIREHDSAGAGDEEEDDHGVYRECLRNHAASLGGHAVDGCGEFMPSPAADIAVPSSLLCSACGCHRNFHRRVLRRRSSSSDDSPPHRISPPPHYSTSHMLLALRSAAEAADLATSAPAPARKRYRTRFTAEQKEGMQDLSERLAWRMRRHDEGIVEERCREIGVGKGVFKVWMHNNKHNFLGGASSRRKEAAAAFFVSGAAAAGSLDESAAAAGTPNCVGAVDGDGRMSESATVDAMASGGACSSSS